MNGGVTNVVVFVLVAYYALEVAFDILEQRYFTFQGVEGAGMLVCFHRDCIQTLQTRCAASHFTPSVCIAVPQQMIAVFLDEGIGRAHHPAWPHRHLVVEQC